MSHPDHPDEGAAVSIPPHDAGWMLRLRIGPDGAKEALVAWREMIEEGFQGGFRDRKEWLPLLGLAPIEGVDYTDVPWEPEEPYPSAENPAVAESGPEGWPEEVLPPSAEGWQSTAAAWLLDGLPPNYRAHEQLRTYPLALAVMARHHLDQALIAARRGYGRVAVDHRGQLEPHIIEQLLGVYRMEGRRLQARQGAVHLIEQALRQETPRTS
ncbi:hypothetical protein ACIBHY_53975 [Nonomuraea sp. NPDC050547]|uniref:hypothetical protein n=1 Tax=Nonomuraea sp. NPDC050547 TaxID=3364368 RepID=UPI0037B4418B